MDKSTHARESAAVIAAMPVEVWDARFFTPDQARAIGELINCVWPKPTMSAEKRASQQLAIGREYRGPAEQAPRALVVVEAGRLLAHAAIVPRVAIADGREISIAGLSRVCTDPAARGRGFGEQVVRAALDLVDAGVFDCSLFQVSERVRPFYERLGAVTVQNRIVNSLAADPLANPFWDDLVMRYPAGGGWPTGTIDLRGPGY
jgi:GNAT superfamily N-acetyltransferase